MVSAQNTWLFRCYNQQVTNVTQYQNQVSAEVTVELRYKLYFIGCQLPGAGVVYQKFIFLGISKKNKQTKITLMRQAKRQRSLELSSEILQDQIVVSIKNKDCP